MKHESKHKIDPLWKEIQEDHGYKLLSKLGEGSFGEVYKAKCTTTGEHFAIKLIKKPFEDEYSAR